MGSPLRCRLSPSFVSFSLDTLFGTDNPGSGEKLVSSKNIGCCGASCFVRSLVQVPFLNLMANIQQRAGGVHIRLGGNTQDFAYYVDSIEDGHALGKEKKELQNPVSSSSFLDLLMSGLIPAYHKTDTPAVLFTKDLFYLMGNISSNVNVRWYLGKWSS
jgi:hypothetical protein